MPEEEPKLSPKIVKYFYAAVLTVGLVFYISWGILFGKWLDPGVYAVTVVLVGFGIVGILHYSHLETEKLK
ncbi:MAG: hypothetical protein QMD21_05285 [Candidatus Thermoplasmatota archaeon]|nr:hypothetical protein [Candidatus Thermoplasmatota archaeon]MDI6856176.1 hypothetical protein [Candidatus Thermoplasmatota archaeon]MDI6887749.1 hypothetical protein [Candidatus Thermoplasmatota archaeon]